MVRSRRRGLKVQILMLADCTPLPSVGIADLLRKAVELSFGVPGAPGIPIEIRLIAAGESRAVRGAGGIEITCDATLAEVTPGDLVVVSALDPDVLAHLEMNKAVVPFLKRAHAGGSDVASVCTGAFLLAEAGLLDGREAATHWAFQGLMAERYPSVKIVPEAIVVDSGRIITTGGATSFLNMTLVLVERLLGEEVARACSKMFLIDVNKPPQGAYAILAPQKQHSDEGILRVQNLIEQKLSGAPSVEEMARAAHASVRTFARRFRKATGSSPREYQQRVRVEAAKRALESGEESVASVATRVGYGDPVAFRKLFVRLVGLTPSEYRARYGRVQAPGGVAAVLA
ncbi:MAG: helix-turn-helix domain-containing protein [Polyangiaceae bacterium]